MTKIKIERVGCMPNKETFKMPPVLQLLKEEMGTGKLAPFQEEIWVDPFSRNTRFCILNNDIDPKTNADYHQDALEFLKEIDSNHVDGVLYDGPYSQRQLKESYQNVGFHYEMNNSFWSNIRNEIGRILKPNAKAISFGWNSAGIGKKYCCEIQRILLLAHGSQHNDTIVTVDKKIQERLI